MVHALWSLYVPSQVVTPEGTLFDLHNGSDRDITVSSVMAVYDASVAVVGEVSIQLFLTRTTAVGSGGTDATSEGIVPLSCTISRIQQVALPTGVTARMTPTTLTDGGAVICERHVNPEETLVQMPVEFLGTLLTVPEGTGIRIVQGAVESVGQIGFQILFY